MIPFGGQFQGMPMIPGGLLGQTPQLTLNKANQLQMLGNAPLQQQLLMRQSMLPQAGIASLAGLGIGGLNMHSSLPSLHPFHTGGIGFGAQKNLLTPVAQSGILDKISKVDQYRLRAAQEEVEELRLKRERDMTNSRLDQDNYVRRRKDALQDSFTDKNMVDRQQGRQITRNAQSVIDLRLPASKRYETANDKSRESSLDRSASKNGLYEIRDELAKNPRRRHNKVEAYWLDETQQKEQVDKEWWDKGKWDVVKQQHYWDNGKYIPEDIGVKVKEIINKEVLMMKGKMQRDEVSMLEQIKSLKDQTKETDKARIKALENLKKIKSKLHKQQVKEDMRHNYIYDVLFERWKDRERKLEDKYQKFPAVNSFPMELRKTEFHMKQKTKKPGELPSDSKVLQNTSVKAMDDMWPQMSTLDDYCNEKVNQDIFRAENLNKVNARRLHDLDKFQLSDDALEKIDNGMFDFLNRESNQRVINPNSVEGKNLYVSNDVLRNYQEVHVKDYISPLEQFSRQVVHNGSISNPHKSVDPLIHKLNAMR
eukprot:403364019